MDNFILRVKNVCKEFPGAKALDNVSIDIEKGQIHALVGENGAGREHCPLVFQGE